jgi:hypothetical protein
MHRKAENGCGKKSFDTLTSFIDVLGKHVSEAPDNYDRGELLLDTAMDLETNASRGLQRQNSLLVERGAVPEDAVVKMVQTFRSGTNEAVLATRPRRNGRPRMRGTCSCHNRC